MHLSSPAYTKAREVFNFFVLTAFRSIDAAPHDLRHRLALRAYHTHLRHRLAHLHGGVMEL